MVGMISRLTHVYETPKSKHTKIEKKRKKPTKKRTIPDSSQKEIWNYRSTHTLGPGFDTPCLEDRLRNGRRTTGPMALALYMSLSIGDFDLFTFFLCFFFFFFPFLFSCIICPEPKAGRYFQRLWGSPALHLLWEIAGIIIWEEYPQGSAILYNLLQRVVVLLFLLLFLFCLYYHSYGIIYKNLRSALSRNPIAYRNSEYSSQRQ